MELSGGAIERKSSSGMPDNQFFHRVHIRVAAVETEERR
jgi:hypothetical protein